MGSPGVDVSSVAAAGKRNRFLRSCSAALGAFVVDGDLNFTKVVIVQIWAKEESA